MKKIRALARRWLPERARKPLGAIAGHFHTIVIRWVQGLIFDLQGGIFRVDGCSYQIPRDITSRAYRSCFFDGTYEAEERELVQSHVRSGDSVLELGACLGVISCVTNRILDDKARHVVVEGNPFCIPALHRNRQINQSGFLVENCAVSNSREATFYLHPVYVVGGTTQRETSRPVRIPGRSLGELEERYGPFSVLIMDIEGAELEIFRASAEQLGRYRLVIVELHEWAIGAEGVARCRELLTGAGLRFQSSAGITEAWQRGTAIDR